MPVYEYHCRECGETFDLFARSSNKKQTPTCPKCESSKVKKRISLFGVGGSSGSGVGAASCASGPV